MEPSDKQPASRGETSDRDSSSRFCSHTPDFTYKDEALSQVLRQGNEDKMKVVDMIISRKLSTQSGNHIWEMVGFIASLQLETAKDYFFEKKELVVAKHHVKQGRKLARRLQDISLITCFEYYWGRIDFLQGHFDRAFAHFAAAEPHADDKECAPDTEDTRAWLHMCMCGSEIQEKYRAQELRTFFKGIMDVDAMQTMRVTPPRWALKRKRHEQSWDLVLRSALSRQKEHSDKSSGKHKPTVWMVHDTEDTPQHASEDRATDGKNLSQNMEWQDKPKFSKPSLGQCKFTVRCYPRGVAPRTRPMTIFPHQRGEVIMPKEKWESLERNMKDKKVTMDWLAKERVARALDWEL